MENAAIVFLRMMIVAGRVGEIAVNEAGEEIGAAGKIVRMAHAIVLNGKTGLVAVTGLIASSVRRSSIALNALNGPIIPEVGESGDSSLHVHRA